MSEAQMQSLAENRLETTRLTLRPFEWSDRDGLVRLANDFEVVKHTARMPFPYTLNEAERFLLKVTAQEYVWAITALETGVLMGAAGLKPIENTAQFHIGYWLGRPFWGQGHATEAVRCILDYAERTFGPGCVLAEVYVDNTASRRLLGKVGFRATGRSEGYSRARGSPVTKIDMVLDRQASPSR